MSPSASGNAEKLPGESWKKTVTVLPLPVQKYPEFAETRSRSPSPSRSAAATERGKVVAAMSPSGSGNAEKLPGESWKKTVRLLPLPVEKSPEFAETTSWSPSPSRSAAATERGKVVAAMPPSGSGKAEKLPGESWKKTVRLLPLPVEKSPEFAETTSWSPSPSRSAAATETGETVIPGPPSGSGEAEKFPGV